jgi:hypothetical protein
MSSKSFYTHTPGQNHFNAGGFGIVVFSAYHNDTNTDSTEENTVRITTYSTEPGTGNSHQWW